MTELASPPLPGALAAIVSEQYVSADPNACAGYAVQGIVPACVVAPGSLEELAAVMRVAHERRAAVVPWGGGTQQSLGNLPERIDMVVRTERLNRVLIHEPDDLTISVEAGTTIGALREYLAPHGQMLPLDPPLPVQATIGGLIATAADGPRRLGYGTLRNLLIGITVVEASGQISRGGGMVVKNVSGFDMMKLYLGSFGTLAINASANFKLLPIPRAAAALICAFDAAAAAFTTIEALQLTQLTPTAAEYLNDHALQALELEGRCALALRAEGLAAAVDRHIIGMTELATRNGATGLRELRGPQEAELWSRIANLPQAATLAPDEALLKLTALPIETERAIAQIEALAARHGGQATIDARALSGVIYARLRPVAPESLRSIAAALPGIRWIATTLADVPRWGAPPPGIELMQRIKTEFDPAGILNRGRYVAGM
ncbi:MAG TPA: FAD-binding oxidoreductase [Roseiflexaceae bacterium]